jgi:tetratricopeptide (TPR) repeat protein
MRDGWVDRARANGKFWLLGCCILLLFVLLFWRDSISQLLIPDPRMNRQIERAQAALAQGRLSAADGSGARELFESVLAADPDQMLARQGLVDVRKAAIAGTELALRQHRLAEARKNLMLAQALSAPTVQLQPLRARLQDLDAASSDTSALLAQAATPGLDDKQALALLEKVLSLDADNEVALDGRGEILATWLVRAEALLAANRVSEAQKLIQEVIDHDPGHVDLPPVQGKLGEALAQVHREQARTLDLAGKDERAGRYEKAARRYLQLANAGSDSPAVQEGLHRLAARVARLAQRQAADFQFREAEGSLARARRWYPQAPEIAIAAQSLTQSRMAQKRLRRAPASNDPRQLPQLIAEAEQAMAREDYITPPGTSAWDKLRIATALAPQSPQVHKLQRDFAQASHDCFERAMTAGHLKRAQSCLEANLALEPTGSAANAARQRLADRWLGYAEERIAANDFDEAEKALEFARHWQPGHPMLKTMATRLRRARRGSR